MSELTDPGQEMKALGAVLHLDFPESLVDELHAGGEEGKIPDLPLLDFNPYLDTGSVWGATEWMRSCRGDLKDRPLVTIWIEAGRALCLDLAREGQPVVEVDLEPGAAAPLDKYTSFAEYLSVATKAALTPRSAAAPPATGGRWFRAGIERLIWHLEHPAFTYDHKEGGQIPRAHLWRPYRFCVQDVILGITVVRHDPRCNRLEVDVFLTAAIEEYEYDSGCRALALILLSDAYKSGGSMEIMFTGRVEGGRIPREFVELANSNGVGLKHVAAGRISPSEAKALYLALTGFRASLRSVMAGLEQEGRLSSAAICYAMHHGVWSLEELEAILGSSTDPDDLLTGRHTEEHWHLFQRDLFIGRNALLGGLLDRRLRGRESQPQDAAASAESRTFVELEDNEVAVNVEYDSGCWVKIYRLQEDWTVTIPWLFSPLPDRTRLGPGKALRVLVRGRDTEDQKELFAADLQSARELAERNPYDIVCLLVPADFRHLGLEPPAGWDIGIIICPEFIHQIDADVRAKMESVRLLRQ